MICGSATVELHNIDQCDYTPEIFVFQVWHTSGNDGPQFSSNEMKEFSDSYGLRHITTSPPYPQANGLADRTVKTAKNLLGYSPDPLHGSPQLPGYAYALVCTKYNGTANGKANQDRYPTGDNQLYTEVVPHQEFQDCR